MNQYYKHGQLTGNYKSLVTDIMHNIMNHSLCIRFSCSLRIILVGNAQGISKVMKLDKKFGIRRIIEEIRDFEWDCFKDNEAETISYMLGFEEPLNLDDPNN